MLTIRDHLPQDASMLTARMHNALRLVAEIVLSAVVAVAIVVAVFAYWMAVAGLL